jgi:hypothetical protein
MAHIRMDAKLQLSAEEMRLVTDPAWILTKNSVIRKVVEMFGELSERVAGDARAGAVGAGCRGDGAQDLQR